MTTTVTKESLSARIADLESGARSLKEDYTLAAYKMLLATMEAEPVAWRWRSGPGAQWHLASRADVAGEVEPLYRHAPPAPVAPKKIDGSRLARVHLDMTTVDKVDAYVKGWNACRAAMLNGGKP